MKHFRNIKNLVAMVLVICLFAAVPVSATTINDAKKKKEAAQKELDAINKEISSLENQKAEIASEILSLDSELDELVVNLELLAHDLEVKTEELALAEQDYEAAVLQEKAQYEAMKLRIQYIYEEGDMDYLTLFLKTQSIADFLTRTDYAQEIHEQDRNMLEAYQAIKEEVAMLKAQLEIEKADLETLQAEYEHERDQLEVVLAEKEAEEANFASLLADAKKKASDFKKTISEQNAKIKKLEEEARKKAQASQSGSSGGSSSGSKPVVSGGGSGSEIANYALQFVGNPYVFGGTSLTHGADCSGFTQSVFRQFGITLPRTSGAQAGAGVGVSYSQAQPGDLICYSGHVGIYIGNGQIVHASSERTGIKVSSATYRGILAVRRCY